LKCQSWLLKQVACVAFNFALAKAGSSSAAKIAMMAMTTSSSIKVKPLRLRCAKFFLSIICISVYLAILNNAGCQNLLPAPALPPQPAKGDR